MYIPRRMRADNDIPRVLDIEPASTISSAERERARYRAKHGLPMYDRDKVVSPYDVRRGKWV